MPKWKIVNKLHYAGLRVKITQLQDEIDVLKGEKIVLKGIIDESEKEVEYLKTKHELDLDKLRETYQEDIEKEKEKHIRFLAKQKEKTLQTKKKWLNAYPDEEYKGD